MSDLGRNIRTIANTEELQRQINDLQTQITGDDDKIGINGSRSIAYKGANGGIGKASGETDMAMIQEDVGTALDDFSDGLLDAFDDESGNQDGTGDDGDASNLDGFTEDLDGYKDTTPQLGEKFKKLSGLGECGGTAEAEVMLNGLFVPPNYDNLFEGYNADQDPRLDQFAVGTWYQYAGNVVTNSSNVYDTATAALAVLEAGDPGSAPFAISNITSYDPSVDTTVQVNYTNKFAGGILSINIYTSGCVIGTDAWCPSTSEPGEWPSDDKHQLSFDGAQFKTSEFEPKEDVYNPWDNDTSQIDACTSSGESVNLKPTGDGGVEVTYGTGESFSMDASGTVIATSNAVL